MEQGHRVRFFPLTRVSARIDRKKAAGGKVRVVPLLEFREPPADKEAESSGALSRIMYNAQENREPSPFV